MTTPNPITILQNGITSILDGINNLLPIWSTTATNLDNTAQAVTQLAAAVGQNQRVNVSVSQITVSLPDEYKGAKDKAAYFIRACNQYFTRVSITQDDVKVSTALALMKGDKASKWAENQLELIQENQTGALVCWADFVTEFKKHFGDRSPDFTAASKIHNLVQGSKTADEYNTDFNNLKNDTKWNEPALIDRYCAGLNPDLLMSVYKCDPVPSTLQEWQDKAELLDKRERELKVQMTQNSQARRYAKSFQPIANTSTTSGTIRPAVPYPSPPPIAAPVPRRDSNAMDVDHTPRRPPLTCFKCGKIGHMARNCRSNVIKVVDVGEMTDEQKQSVATQLREQGF